MELIFSIKNGFLYWSPEFKDSITMDLISSAIPNELGSRCFWADMKVCFKSGDSKIISINSKEEITLEALLFNLLNRLIERYNIKKGNYFAGFNNGITFIREDIE